MGELIAACFSMCQTKTHKTVCSSPAEITCVRKPSHIPTLRGIRQLAWDAINVVKD